MVSEVHHQHLATRRHAGLFDFSFMGLYEFADRAPLEPLQSRRLGRIAPGRIAYTLLMGADGRVVNDATVWHLEDGRWWLFTGRREDAAWIAQRATPRVCSGENAVIALQGPASGAILARFAGEALARSLRYFDQAPLPAAAGPGHVGRIGYSGELGYEIVVPAAREAAVKSALHDAGDGLVEGTFEAANSLRIESGYVLFDREITGGERPGDLGLGRLVERAGATYAAGPTQRLVGLRIESGPAGPRPWRARARLTSECASPLFSCRLGLGFVDAAATDAGTPVQLQDGRLARVARLPFYDPARRRPRVRPL